jgi:hypothetical protein
LHVTGRIARPPFLTSARKNFIIGLFVGSVVFLIQKGQLVFMPSPYAAESFTSFLGYLAVSMTVLMTVFQTLFPQRFSVSAHIFAFALGLACPYDLYTIYGFLS